MGASDTSNAAFACNFFIPNYAESYFGTHFALVLEDSFRLHAIKNAQTFT